MVKLLHDGDGEIVFLVESVFPSGLVDARGDGSGITQMVFKIGYKLGCVTIDCSKKEFLPPITFEELSLVSNYIVFSTSIGKIVFQINYIPINLYFDGGRIPKPLLQRVVPISPSEAELLKLAYGFEEEISDPYLLVE